MATRKTETQRIIEIFNTVPLHQAELLLDVAGSLVKSRRKADPFDTHVSVNPEAQRPTKRRRGLAAAVNLSSLPDTDRE